MNRPGILWLGFGLGLGLLLALAGLAPDVRADDTPATPDAMAPATPVGPALELEYLDLLPLDEFERADFRTAHLELAQSLEGIAGRLGSRMRQLAKRENPKDDAGRTLQAEITELRKKSRAPLAALREALRPHGLTDALLATMAQAPKGEGRLERYSHRLYLLLDDLEPAQRRILERAVTEVDAAYLSAQALHDRTQLALKQSEIEPRLQNGILSGFRRQTRVVETRFWRLVDYICTDDQKATVWDWLPTKMRQHASAQDHVYALPGLTVVQGARVRALLTEIEAESAPDQALVRRTQIALRSKDLSREEKRALSTERKDAYARLTELKRFAYDTANEILTDDQIHAMKAIPPRVSINDRRRDGRRVFEGMEFSLPQEMAFEVLRKEGKQAARVYRRRMQDLRRETGDVGPDSPQVMMMEMMMAGARGEAQDAQRHLLGRAFLEILMPEQVSGWVMGLYGDRR